MKYFRLLQNKFLMTESESSSEIQKAKLVTLHDPTTGKEQRFALSQNIIGEGKYATVHKAVHLQDSSRVYAVKVIKLQSGEVREQCLKELKVIQQLPRSANLVYIHREHLESLNNLYIFEEFCQGGSLHDYRVNRETPFSENQIFDMFFQLFNGYRQLFQAGIFHQDIKPNNVLLKYPILSEEGSNIFKICDFGISQLQGSLVKSKIRKGTISYMPPQKLKKQDYIANAKSDIYSLGVTLYEVIFGRHPYLETRVNDYKVYLQRIATAELKPIHQLVPKQVYRSLSVRFNKFYRILERMIDLSESKRISMEQLIQYVQTSEPFKNMKIQEIEQKARLQIKFQKKPQKKWDIIAVSTIRTFNESQNFSQFSKPLLRSSIRKVDNKKMVEKRTFIKQAAAYLTKGLEFMKKSGQFQTVQKQYSRPSQTQGCPLIQTKLTGTKRIDFIEFIIYFLNSEIMYSFLMNFHDIRKSIKEQDRQFVMFLQEDCEDLKNQFFKMFSDIAIENKKLLYEEVKSDSLGLIMILRMELIQLFQEIFMVRINFKQDLVAALFIKKAPHILMMLKMLNDQTTNNEKVEKEQEMQKCEEIMLEFDSITLKKKEQLGQILKKQIQGSKQIMFDDQENSDQWQILDQSWLEEAQNKTNEK